MARVIEFLKDYVKNVFIGISQFGNTLFMAGDPDETISSRAGKARAKGRIWGCVLCKLLDALDKDHCRKAVEPDEGRR